MKVWLRFGRRGERAAGYAVGKNLILTAGRVLESGPPYYLCRHYDSCDDDSDWIEISENDIKWQDHDLDAALIDCRQLLDVMDWGIVSSEKPPPDCMGRDGELLSRGEGVSGMPVFVGRKIIGVTQSIPPNLEAKKRYATPTWKLLENAAFRKAIGYDEQTALANKVKRKLVKELKQSPAVVNALIDQEPLGIGNDVIGFDAEQRVERLVERLLLLKTDTGAVIKALYEAHGSFNKSDEQGERDILVNVAQLIVPAIYDYGVVQWTRSQQAAPLVPLPVHIKTSVEIIMAGVDGRETQLRHRKNEKDYPEGELSLPPIPECGIDPGSVVAREAERGYVNRKFNPMVEAEVYRRPLDAYLEANYYQSESGAPQRTPEERIKLTAGALARRRDLNGQTFYMLFYPHDIEEQRAIHSLVQVLKQDYPAIMFLSLDTAVEQEERDRNLVYPFCCMLPLQRGDSVAVTAKPRPETTGSSPTAPPKEPSSMRFKIALSYPGERRDFVEQVATRLADKVGRDRVLYDRYHEAEFAQIGLDAYLQRLYHDESELIAVFLCADYEHKQWCGLEWRVVRDLIKQRQESTVMLLRFDETALPGLLSIDGYAWIGNRSPQDIADLILRRLEINAKQTPAPSPSSTPSPTPTPPSPGLQTWKEKLGQFVKRIWR